MAGPLPVLPGVYYGYVYMAFESRRYGSTFTFKTATPPADAVTDGQWAQFVANALAASWGDNMMPRYNAGVTGVDTRVYALGHPTVPAAVGHAAHNGVNSGAMAAASAAAVIRHQVNRRGRGSQGHTAISPLQNSELDGTGDTITDGLQVALTSDFGDFITGVQTDWASHVPSIALQYVQLSRKGAGTTYEILNSFAEKLLGTERSRTLRP
jgi:hypothetical protein